MSASAQTQHAAWQPAKTAWGDPDLQGVWPGNMGVPMQRPAAFGERATLTEDEFAKKEEQAKRQAQADSESTAASDTKVGYRASFLLDRTRQTDEPGFTHRRSAQRKAPRADAEAEKYRKEAAGQGCPANGAARPILRKTSTFITAASREACWAR